MWLTKILMSLAKRYHQYREAKELKVARQTLVVAREEYEKREREIAQEYEAQLLNKDSELDSLRSELALTSENLAKEKSLNRIAREEVATMGVAFAALQARWVAFAGEKTVEGTPKPNVE